MSVINPSSFDHAEFEGFSNDLLQELKIRARLRLNALQSGDDAVLTFARIISKRRRWPWPQEWKLQHALNIVASELDFRDWHQARAVLGGTAKRGDDMGGFWYARSGGVLLLNHWFSSYAEAQEYQRGGDRNRESRWLFPYGKQFVVGDRHYLQTLSMDPELPLWEQVGRDLYGCYGSAAWHLLCAVRLQATRGLPPPISRR